MYINLISTYAWCNVHDITWATKASDVPGRLPSVQLDTLIPGRTDISVRMYVDTQNGDIILHGYTEYLNELDTYFDSQRQQCEAHRSREPSNWGAAEKQEDYFRTFRTMTLLCWLGANSALVMIVVNIPSISRFTPTAEGGKGLVYVGVVLWAYAGVTGFQYCCTVLYALSKLCAWLSGRIKAVARPSRSSKGQVEGRAKYQANRR